MAGRTVLVVAHRLSTIRNADKIVVFKKGVVIEQVRPDGGGGDQGGALTIELVGPGEM